MGADKNPDSGRSGGGDSGGGPYPRAGKKPRKDGFMATGGQTIAAYHGHGQLGDRKTGNNPNAPAREDDL